MSRYVPAHLRRQVRERFQCRCAYCQTAEQLTAVTFEVEHIVPRSAGGQTRFQNLCLSCPTCNRYKADRTEGIDPDTGEAVRLFAPHQDRWSEHFTWTDDATELVPLTAIGRATIAALRMNRPQLIRVRRMWVAMGEHPPKLE